MEIISHRGNGFEYPENSMPAFMKAVEGNFSIELDLRITSDKVPFIIHDKKIDRILDAEGKLIDYTSNQINQFHFRTDNSLKLVSFSEFVEQFKTSKSNFFVHIQDINEAEIIEKAISIIIDSGIKDQFRFFAVDEMSVSLIEKVKKIDKDISVGLHLPENSRYFSEQYFRMADFIWVDEIHGKWFSKDIVTMAKKMNKKVYAISPELIKENIFYDNYKKRWKDIVEYGFDGICSDYPEQLKKFF